MFVLGAVLPEVQVLSVYQYINERCAEEGRLRCCVPSQNIDSVQSCSVTGTIAFPRSGLRIATHCLGSSLRCLPFDSIQEISVVIRQVSQGNTWLLAFMAYECI